jgi:hypothetical protein
MMILGIDKGSTLTKTASGIMLPSIVREVTDDVEASSLDTEGTKITLNDKKYVIGESGDYATDLLKSRSDATRTLIFASCALSCIGEDNDISLLVGLPIRQYTSQKDTMQALLSTTAPVAFSTDNGKGKFFLRHVGVFPEAAAAFYSQDTAKYTNKSVLLLDIGGLSVDTALFVNKKMKKYETYELGTMPLFNSMANTVNQMEHTKLNAWDMYRINTHGLFINGEKRRNDYLLDMIDVHVKEIHRRMKLDYDLLSVDEIQVLGGGGELMFTTILEYIVQAKLMPQSVLANAIGLQNIAEVIYGEGSKDIQPRQRA